MSANPPPPDQDQPTPRVTPPPAPRRGRVDEPESGAAHRARARHSDDPAHVYTEEEVPNARKALPTTRPITPFLGAVGGAVALVGAVLAVATDMGALALILAVAGLLLAAIAAVLAWTDVRAGRAAPTVCAAIAVVALIIAAFNVADPDVRPAQPARPGPVGPLAEPDRQDHPGEADRARPAAGTVNDRDVPADPADIAREGRGVPD